MRFLGLTCKECDSKVGHTNWCQLIINEDFAAKYFTEYQLKFLVKVLKKYKDLRKSHFIEVNSGLKSAKITEELILIDGLIEYLK